MIVRPVILTDGPKTNAYRALVDPRDWTCGFISRADIEAGMATHYVARELIALGHDASRIKTERFGATGG